MLGGAALNWAFWAVTGRRVVAIGLDAMLGLFCEPADPGPRLTGREPEAGRMVAGAWPAIARRLSVAPRTAGADPENIRRELQVPSHAQIAAWATGHRLRPGAAR
jgi:hypothetical protein